MRLLVRGARACLFAIAILDTSCSLVIKDDLEGLSPYPKDAGIDGSSMMRADADGGDARDGGVVDVQGSDIVSQPDGLLRDAAADLVISDRVDPVAADATSERGGTPPEDASADAIDDGAFPDRAPHDVGPPLEDASADRIDDIAFPDANQDVGDASSEDAPSTPDDAGDATVPPRDGGIVGLGNWVVSGNGALSPSKYEVRGWMIPTTSLRGTTRSGLTIEGWLQ